MSLSDDVHVLLDTDVSIWSDDQILEYLQKASEKPAIAPPLLEKVLVDCTKREIPSCREWFEQELKLIASGMPRAWKDFLLYDIVRTAASKIPGTDPKYRKSWLTLLSHPRYCSLALGTLVSSHQTCLDLLDIWWSANTEDRDRCLHNLLEELFVHCRDRRSLRDAIEKKFSSWPEDMRIVAERTIKRRQ